MRHGLRFSLLLSPLLVLFGWAALHDRGTPEEKIVRRLHALVEAFNASDMGAVGQQLGPRFVLEPSGLDRNSIQMVLWTASYSGLGLLAEIEPGSIAIERDHRDSDLCHVAFSVLVHQSSATTPVAPWRLSVTTEARRGGRGYALGATSWTAEGEPPPVDLAASGLPFTSTVRVLSAPATAPLTTIR